MTTAQVIAILAVVLPALGVVLWPLLRGGGAVAQEAAPPPVADRTLELTEERNTIYRALRELDFDHEAGHLSADDYGSLRSRYEGRAAQIVAEIDRLPRAEAERPVAAVRPPSPAAPASRRAWTRHPITVAVGAVVVLSFGVLIGVNAGRFSAPEPPAAQMGAGPTAGQPALPPDHPPIGPAAGTRPGAPPAAPPGAPPAASPGARPGPRPGAPAAMVGGDPGQPLPPAVLSGMLQAARESLMAGRYQDAISAYQAVLKRDAKNVDAMTHLALIVAIGGHADSAVETFGKVLAIDPNYAPAYLYRGQVLYETKQDYAGAVKDFERFVKLVPSGEDHAKVQAMLKEARGKQAKKP